MAKHKEKCTATGETTKLYQCVECGTEFKSISSLKVNTSKGKYQSIWVYFFVQISRTLHFIGGGLAVVPQGTKTRGRTIPISESLHSVIDL